MLTPHAPRLAARLLALSLVVAIPGLASAQGSGTPTRKVISIGNYPRVDGLRINFRDRDLDRVRGINLTVWRPQRDMSTGTVSGLALGVPLTGVGDLRGMGIAAFGLEASGDISGITLAGIGAGAGGTLGGISVAGIGLGSGEGLRGIALGGVGVGTGGDVRGIALGGIGAGAGGTVRGVVAGGIGAAAGNDVVGLAVGGIGVGAGERVSGLAIGGIGVGAGSTLHGIGIGGIGVGAPMLEGGALAPIVGGEEVRGVVIAPVLFRTSDGGSLTGASLSAANVVRGHQHGLTIGVVNFAHSLNGVQLGVVNIVTGNPSARRVLPVINWGGER